jgi:hypothetical protein
MQCLRPLRHSDANVRQNFLRQEDAEFLSFIAFTVFQNVEGSPAESELKK